MPAFFRRASMPHAVLFHIFYLQPERTKCEADCKKKCEKIKERKWLLRPAAPSLAIVKPLNNKKCPPLLLIMRHYKSVRGEHFLLFFLGLLSSSMQFHKIQFCEVAFTSEMAAPSHSNSQPAHEVADCGFFAMIQKTNSPV